MSAVDLELPLYLSINHDLEGQYSYYSMTDPNVGNELNVMHETFPKCFTNVFFFKERPSLLQRYSFTFSSHRCVLVSNKNIRRL